MSTTVPAFTPVVTIFVRHSADCKYHGDEFARRCKCRKHLRWTQNGTQHRRQAGTRSWEEAERAKRQLEDQLAGRAPSSDTATDGARFLSDALDLFIKDKKVEGLTDGVIKKYTLELERLKEYCEQHRVFTVQAVTRELLTEFCATWEKFYPSSTTRSKVRERLRSFLRYCYEAQWIPRIPALPKIKVDEAPTLPLTADEYARLLDALHVANPRRWDGKISTQGLTATTHARIRALIQLMRWSGLAIRDAATLKTSQLKHEAEKGIYRVVTKRQKTGTDVSVPIPQEVAEELLAVAAANSNSQYIFWTGIGAAETIAKTWTSRYIRPAFEAAKIPSDGHMVSHRLRDTFAVDLLEKGIPLEEVSKLLGHESIKTTEKHYAKWVKGRQDRLDNLVVGTWNNGDGVGKGTAKATRPAK
jgi:integrase/recombinase XerD